MGRCSGRTAEILATRSTIASSVLMAWFFLTGLFIQLCLKQSECNNPSSFQFRVNQPSSFRSPVSIFSGPRTMNNYAGDCGRGIQRLPPEIPSWRSMQVLQFNSLCASQPVTIQTLFTWTSGFSKMWTAISPVKTTRSRASSLSSKNFQKRTSGMGRKKIQQLQRFTQRFTMNQMSTLCDVALRASL